MPLGEWHRRHDRKRGGGVHNQITCLRGNDQMLRQIRCSCTSLMQEQHNDGLKLEEREESSGTTYRCKELPTAVKILTS